MNAHTLLSCVARSDKDFHSAEKKKQAKEALASTNTTQKMNLNEGGDGEKKRKSYGSLLCCCMNEEMLIWIIKKMWGEHIFFAQILAIMKTPTYRCRSEPSTTSPNEHNDKLAALLRLISARRSHKLVWPELHSLLSGYCSIFIQFSLFCTTELQSSITALSCVQIPYMCRM